METTDFDTLLADYKSAVDRWLAAIRAEEALANSDHSVVEWELWDDADFKVQDAEKAAKQARDAYKDALREKNYNF
jgi:Tfp pilus assembly protein PilN